MKNWLRLFVTAVSLILIHHTLWAEPNRPRAEGLNAVIAFTPGDATLTPSAQSQLSLLLNQAASLGELKAIYIAAWPDAGTATRASIGMVGQRISAIRLFIGARSSAPITGYNRADRNSPFPTVQPLLFRTYGKPSKGVVVVVLKTNK